MIFVYIYSDAAFMCHEDLRSRGGVMIMMAGGVVAAKSKKLSILCKSSTEAELVALETATDEGEFICELKRACGMETNKYDVMEDNMSVLAMVKNGRPMSQRTRHISMRYFAVCELVKADRMELVWCPTERMLADILTKPLVGSAFNNIRNMVTGVVET